MEVGAAGQHLKVATLEPLNLEPENLEPENLEPENLEPETRVRAWRSSVTRPARRPSP